MVPAYSVPIVRPACQCGRPAEREVRNGRNERISDRCTSCAKKLVEKINLDAATRK